TALALSAVLWLPTVALLGSISAGRLSPADNVYWSLHPLSLVDLVLPRLFADPPPAPPLPEALFEGPEPFPLSLYAGVASVLAVWWGSRAGGGSPGPPSRRGMAALLPLPPLGRPAPRVPAVRALPPFSLFRYPVKYVIAAALFWGLLVGFGVDAWRREWDRAD